MSTSTPPPAAASGDSLPPAPTLPGVPLWSDSDPPLPAQAPVAAFAGLVSKPADGAMFHPAGILLSIVGAIIVLGIHAPPPMIASAVA